MVIKQRAEIQHHIKIKKLFNGKHCFLLNKLIRENTNNA